MNSNSDKIMIVVEVLAVQAYWIIKHIFSSVLIVNSSARTYISAPDVFISSVRENGTQSVYTCTAFAIQLCNCTTKKK